MTEELEDEERRSFPGDRQGNQGPANGTPAEIDQLRGDSWRNMANRQDGNRIHRRRAEDAGQKVLIQPAEEAEGTIRRGFEDLLHFKTLEDAEVSIMRLDELMAQVSWAGRARRRGTCFERSPARQTPRGDDFAQPQS